MIESFVTCYHGTINVYSKSILDNIEINRGRTFTDFGQGFYVTNNFKQAELWAIEKFKDNLNNLSNVKPAIVKISLDTEMLMWFLHSGRVNIFDNPDDNWSDFIYNCRKEGKKGRKFHSYSMVCGPLADGKIVPLLKRLESGSITKEQFTEYVKPRDYLKNQLSFNKWHALDCIIKKEAFPVETLKLQPR